MIKDRSKSKILKTCTCRTSDVSKYFYYFDLTGPKYAEKYEDSESGLKSIHFLTKKISFWWFSISFIYSCVDPFSFFQFSYFVFVGLGGVWMNGTIKQINGAHINSRKSEKRIFEKFDFFRAGNSESDTVRGLQPHGLC